MIEAPAGVGPDHEDVEGVGAAEERHLGVGRVPQPLKVGVGDGETLLRLVEHELVKAHP